MLKRPTKTCGTCKNAFTELTKRSGCPNKHKNKRSPKSKRVCKNYKVGLPLTPTYKDKKARHVKFNLEEPMAFAFHSGENHMLVLIWETTYDGYGYWRIKLAGIDVENEKILTKELTKGKEEYSFYGEVSIVGASKSELYRTFGYQDDDVKDAEGNIVNKPVEVKIFPLRKD
jgi:hypothetical protein